MFRPDALAASDDGYFVRGIVRDSISDSPLGYASVIVDGAPRGTVADADGLFELTVPETAKALKISCMGYETKTIPIRRTRLGIIAVYLSPQTVELAEVVAHRAKYSKKNNPAVDFVRKLRSSSSLTDPLRHDYYRYDSYTRQTMGLDNVSKENGSFTRMPFLAEHVDTSEISGKPYLTLILSENRASSYHRNSPRRSATIIEATHTDGIDEMFAGSTLSTFLDDALPEFDLYQSDINMLQNRFVSPLSPIGPDFYKYYLTDTVETPAEKQIVLSFYPRNRASLGFMGHIYVPVGDTTMFIRKVEMRVPPEINLNYIDNMAVSQTFDRAPDGSRLKTSDEIALELSVAGKGAMFARRSTFYENHSFEAFSDSVFNISNSGLPKNAGDSVYWASARITGLKPGESRTDKLMSQIRSVPVLYWGEKIIRILFSSYISTSSNSKFDIGPVNSMISYNSLEGLRLRAGGMTTAALSPRWFGRFYVAHGFKDHRWKYGAEAEYCFEDKALHSREFPIRSIRATSSYDIYRPGQAFLFTTPDNVILSLRRLSDDRATYQRLQRLEFNYEWDSHFSVMAALYNTRQESSATLQMTDGYGQNIKNYCQNTLEVAVRYAPGEKFYQFRSYRIPVNFDAPAVTLRHRYTPAWMPGTDYGSSVTDLNIQKRWWFSAWGCLDTSVSGAQVWGRAPLLDLISPPANLSYIIEPGTFSLLNPMEFMLSSYVGADVTYMANGAIFNYLPYVKKLKLREVFGVRGFWGDLSKKADPRLNPHMPQFPAGTAMAEMSHTPYLEASVGIDNIFTVLRIDYVWRLTYRNMPYTIDRSGVRVSMRFSF